jgi:hypothetical protein
MVTPRTIPVPVVGFGRASRGGGGAPALWSSKAIISDATVIAQSPPGEAHQSGALQNYTAGHA